MKKVANYSNAKQQAAAILARLGYDRPPVNPLKVAKELDVHVKFANFPGPLDKEVAGFYHAKTDTIYVNEKDSPNRQTFTIAHELGHKLLHEEWAKSTEYQILLRKNLLVDTDSNIYEKEANTFAANLLVPRSFLEVYKDAISIDDMAQLFAVSREVIVNRLNFEFGERVSVSS